MTNKIIWRLKEQPSSESLRELVKDGILTKEEAREILFSSETEEDRDKKSLESEIKFLRDLVEKLSSNQNSRIIETIREVEVPYRRYPWYRKYDYWCSMDSNKMLCVNGAAGTTTYTDTNALKSFLEKSGSSNNFSDIKTF